MKALKEKRISLRSLWRRGLVILSLFALVFASCGDSDSGASSGKRVMKAAITALPTQYLGRPVDLKGVEATVTYYDGSTATIKYDDSPSKFAAYPPIVSGAYDAAGKFYGMGAVRVAVGDGDAVGSEVKTVKVVGILRDNTVVQTLDPWATTPGANPALEFFSQGLHVVVPGGLDNRAQKEAFADDFRDSIRFNKFDFGGLALQADYEDGSVFPLSFDDVDWYVKPDYDLTVGTGDDMYYKGYVFITIGEDTYGWTKKTQSSLPSGYWDKGITVLNPLDAVYTVYDDKVGSGVKVTNAEIKQPFMFWDDNTPAAWLSRLGDAKIEVRYRGTKTVNTFSIKELAEKEKIWYNANPGGAFTDFYILPVKYPYTVKANAEPGVEVYYRGGWDKIAVDVYTQYVSGPTVVNNYGQVVSVDDLEEWRDNDPLLSYGVNEKKFCGQVTVTAVYRAYNNSGKEATIPLSLKPSTYDAGADYLDTESGYDSGAYYYTDFAQVQARNSANTKDKNGKITFYHRVSSSAVEAAFGALFDDEDPLGGYWYSFDQRYMDKKPTPDKDRFKTKIDDGDLFAGKAVSVNKKSAVAITWTVN